MYIFIFLVWLRGFIMYSIIDECVAQPVIVLLSLLLLLLTEPYLDFVHLAFVSETRGRPRVIFN